MITAQNEYDLMMGLAPVGPIEFIIGALIVFGIGWLLTK